MKSQVTLKMLLYRRVAFATRYLLAGLFFWAGIQKAFNSHLFLQEIETFQLLPYRWAWVISIWLPFLEITAAASLLTTRRWAQAGSLIIGVMLLAFLGALVSAWLRGLTLSCGCFGASTKPANYPWLVARDMLMMGMATFIFLTTKNIKKTIRS